MDHYFHWHKYFEYPITQTIIINKSMKVIKTLDADFDFEYHIDYLIEKLQKTKAEYPEYNNLRFDKDYCYEGSTKYALLGDREETEAEKTERLELEKSRLEKDRERELKVLEQLKQKYENH